MPDLHKGEVEHVFDRILVDGMNLAYRCFHTIPTRFNGRKTGLFFGFVNKMVTYHTLYPGAIIHVLWEGEGENRRKQILPTYKGNRLNAEHKSEIPNDFQENIRDLMETLPLISISQWRYDSLEADDLANFFCGLFPKNDRILLVTNDTDWYSFLRPGVFIEDKYGIMGYRNIEKKIGYPPGRTPLFKSVRGCRTDNVEQAIDRISDYNLAEIVKKSEHLDDLISNLSKCGCDYDEGMVRVNHSVVSFFGDLILDAPEGISLTEPVENDEKLNNLLLKWGCQSLRSKLGLK